MTMKYRPKLNPDVDLKGATPETLALALKLPLRPRARRKPVVGDQVGVAEPVMVAGELLHVAVSGASG